MKSEKLKTRRVGVYGVAIRSVRIALFLLLFTIHVSLSTALAQENDLAPPPVKIITKEERSKLDREVDLKARTKLAVEMLKLRIDAAEKLNAADDFDGMFRELGHFRGLLDYTLTFLEKQDAKQNKTLDNYKRLELFLRSIAPRLEIIRRELPPGHENYVREMSIFIRDARRRVLEPLYGDTVVPRGGKNESEK